MKKSLALLLALAMCFVMLAGCGGTPEEEAPEVEEAEGAEPAAEEAVEEAEEPETISTKRTADDTLVYAISQSRTTFDPSDSGNDFVSLMQLIYDGLVKFNAVTKELEPMLATSWEYTDDLTLVFELRDDAYFSNGEKVTGEDVLYSWSRLSESVMWAKQVSIIDFENSTVEGNILTVKFTEHNSDFLDMLADIQYSVIPKAYMEEVGKEGFALAPIGSGPFVLTSFTEAESAKFERRDDYWGETPDYKYVDARIVIEESTRTIGFESGDIDMARIASATAVASFQGREAEGINVNQTMSGTMYYVNLGDICEYFQTRELRLAFAHAVDWEALVKSVWGEGNAAVAQSCLVTNNASYQAVGSYAYDPDLAKQYLAEGGYPDGYTLEMAVANGDTDQQIAEILQAYLADVGIVLNITVTDNALARQMSASGSMDLSFANSSAQTGAMSGCMSGKMAGSNSLLQEIHTDTEEGARFQQYVSDILLAEGEEKDALLKEMQQYVYDQCLWIPIAQPMNTIVSWDYVTGVQDTMDAYMKIAAVRVADGISFVE